MAFNYKMKYYYIYFFLSRRWMTTTKNLTLRRRLTSISSLSPATSAPTSRARRIRFLTKRGKLCHFGPTLISLSCLILSILLICKLSNFDNTKAIWDPEMWQDVNSQFLVKTRQLISGWITSQRCSTFLLKGCYSCCCSASSSPEQPSSCSADTWSAPLTAFTTRATAPKTLATIQAPMWVYCSLDEQPNCYFKVFLFTWKRDSNPRL